MTTTLARIGTNLTRIGAAIGLALSLVLLASLPGAAQTTTTAEDTTTTAAETSTTAESTTSTTSDSDDGSAPTGGADTGAGGSADQDTFPTGAVAGALTVLVAGAGFAAVTGRRRQQTNS